MTPGENLIILTGKLPSSIKGLLVFDNNNRVLMLNSGLCHSEKSYIAKLAAYERETHVYRN